MKREHHIITLVAIALCFSLLGCKYTYNYCKEPVTVTVIDSSEKQALKKELASVRNDLYWTAKNRNTWRRRYNSLEALLPDTVQHLRFSKDGKRIWK